MTSLRPILWVRVNGNGPFRFLVDPLATVTRRPAQRDPPPEPAPRSPRPFGKAGLAPPAK